MFARQRRTLETFQAEGSTETETRGNIEHAHLGKNEKLCSWSIGHVVRWKKMNLKREMKTFIILDLADYGILTSILRQWSVNSD